VTNKEALELALMTLENDNLKVGNIYVNYDIQKALIKLVKKKLEKKRKKEWVGLTDEDHEKIYQDFFHITKVSFRDLSSAIEAKLREKNGA